MNAIPAYDPNASYEVHYQDMVYRREGELALPVRVYQRDGPFPALLDVHGGAWGAGDPLQNAESQSALAASGLVVAAIDFRSSAMAPHPAAMEDISYAVRWLKAHAADFNATSSGLGAVGWSSGGHQVMLGAMRPRLYATLPLPDAPDIDANLAYAVLGWPVIDPAARHRLALEGNLRSRERGVSDFIERHYAYFGDEAGMEEANPQRILDRAELVELPPVLIIQGSADEQLPRMMAERFVESYSLAGGAIELGKYPGSPHGFLREPGPNADRGLTQIKSFIARRLSELRESD
ncbi:MAG: alpha/beta hydrolase fold domain-containing protein [Dehalococcoidia bacterium]|nr:alpha/beta hydrolase fold domain-containing protein [Dehalococcoidia bacterium]